LPCRPPAAGVYIDELAALLLASAVWSLREQGFIMIEPAVVRRPWTREIITVRIEIAGL
jgi:hypothetical protein